MNEKMRGLCACAGIASGNARICETFTASSVVEAPVSLQAAKAKYRSRMVLLQQEEDPALQAHAGFMLALLADPALWPAIEQRVCAGEAEEEALRHEAERVSAALAALPDPYFAARAVDILGFAQELEALMRGQAQGSASLPEAGVILVADSLPVSSLLRLPLSRIRGAVLQQETVFSHAVLYLKAHNIPTLVGVPGIMSAVQPNEPLLLNATAGFVCPCAENTRQEERTAALSVERCPDFCCLDAASAQEILDAPECASVGLVRSEYLFMQCANWPDEDAQTAWYDSLLTAAHGRPVTIRVLDIGRDKRLPYDHDPDETSGLTRMLAHPERLRTQLRALLRASAHGTLRILYPMVEAPEQLRAAQAMLREEYDRLRQNGHVTSCPAQGVMLESRRALLRAADIAADADFASIGSNDVLHSVLGLRRGQGNPDPWNKEALALIQAAGETLTGLGKPWYVCGYAACPELAPRWQRAGAAGVTADRHTLRRITSLLPAGDIPPFRGEKES